MQDCHGNEIEITDMNDWPHCTLMCLRVVIWLLLDCHGNAIEVTCMKYRLGIRLLYMRVVI